MTDVEREQQLVEQGGLVDVTPGQLVEGHSPLRRARRPVHVEPEPDHDRMPLGLGEDPTELAVVDEQVVGPFQVGRDAGDALAGVAGGKRHRGRQQVSGLERPRAEQHRDEERGPRQRNPCAAQPPATRRLVVGDHDEALGGTGACLVEQPAVGRVELGEAADLPLDAITIWPTCSPRSAEAAGAPAENERLGEVCGPLDPGRVEQAPQRLAVVAAGSRIGVPLAELADEEVEGLDVGARR